MRTSYLRKRYPQGTFLICNGAKVFCDFSNENYAWYDGYSEFLNYEMEVFTNLFNLRPPKIILDVGAHWGFYPAFLNNSPFADKISKIISVEPDPFNQVILSKTLEKVNRIPILQSNSAISDKNGYLDLYFGGSDCSKTYPFPNTVSVGKIQAVSLDSLTESFLKEGDILTHVKLDIDGYEPAFFSGGIKTLKRFKPIILMEFWAKGLKVSGVDLEGYWEMLQNNYHVQEACFPGRKLISLKHQDLVYLTDKTTEGITNLVLIPKN